MEAAGAGLRRRRGREPAALVAVSAGKRWPSAEGGAHGRRLRGLGPDGEAEAGGPARRAAAVAASAPLRVRAELRMPGAGRGLWLPSSPGPASRGGLGSGRRRSAAACLCANRRQ